MKELQEKIDIIKEDILDIKEVYLPDMMSIYDASQDMQLKINALNSIIGLKNQYRSDEYKVEQMEAIYERMAKEEVNNEE